MIGNNKTDEIRKIINKWDPYDLIKESGAPINEFQKEVEVISKRVSSDMTISDIEKLVSQVFIESFDDSDFFNEKNCHIVAVEISKVL